MEVDINTSLSDLKSLDNEKFKNLCEKYGLQIKGGLNTAMKNIKAKILLRKMQESFKENSLPGEETAPSDLQPTKPKKFPESPAMNLESLMDLPTEQLRTILGQHGIEVQGGLNPAVKRLKIKKLLARLDSGGAQVQAEQPKFVKPKLAVTKPVKFSDFDSSDEEPARLDVNSNRFFAIKATGNDDKTTPERPNNKTSYLDEKEVNSYIFNEIQPALSRLKELKNRNLTLSPRLPSYRSAVDYVKNENQRDFVSESSFKNNQTAPAKEIRMNMFPKMGNTDHNIISRFINDIDTFNQSEKSNLAYKNLKKFLTDNPNRLVDLGSNGPTILRPPLRHNAVHTACKEGKLAVLQLYFELLTDMKFMKTVFQNTTVDSFFKLSQELLINYFNDHDKLLAETPLHLACKNGQVATVEWLLYNCFMFDGDKWKRILDLSKVDKSGYTALELVNSRMKLAGSKFQSQYESICDIFENLRALSEVEKKSPQKSPLEEDFPKTLSRKHPQTS